MEHFDLAAFYGGSATELQKGTFSIAIDGDLFKVGFILPRTE